MAICSTTCVTDVPAPYAQGCAIVRRPGGIKMLAFVKCDYDTSLLISREAWDTAIAGGDAVLTGLLLGQKPKGTFTKKRLAACLSETTIGGVKTLTFQDYNSGTLCTLFTFWNTIGAAPSKYLMYYVTCDDHVYGPVTDFDLEIDEVIEDSNIGTAFMDGTITWQSTTKIGRAHV